MKDDEEESVNVSNIENVIRPDQAIQCIEKTQMKKAGANGAPKSARVHKWSKAYATEYEKMCYQ